MKSTVKSLKCRNAQGFTLLELLTVMAIMIVLMSIAVGSMIGFSRGASMRAAVSNLVSNISLARQTAMTQRCRTQVIFWKGGGLSHYVICMDGGSNIGGGNDAWFKLSQSKWAQDQLKGAEIYNLSTEEYGVVSENYPDSLTAVNPVTGNTLKWSPGDRLGWLLRSQMHMPQGVTYINGPKPGGVPSTIVFNADGTTPVSGSYEVQITEEAAAVSMVKKIHVKALTGRISVE